MADGILQFFDNASDRCDATAAGQATGMSAAVKTGVDFEGRMWVTLLNGTFLLLCLAMAMGSAPRASGDRAFAGTPDVDNRATQDAASHHTWYWYFAVAGKLIDKTRWLEALETLNKGIVENPSSPELYTMRSEVFHELKDNKAALLDLDRAVRVNSHWDDAYYKRALILEQLGHLKKALQDINTAVELKSLHPEYYAERTAIRIKLGQLYLAAQDATTARRLFLDFKDDNSASAMDAQFHHIEQLLEHAPRRR